jgi:hypothetical protein
MDHPPGDGQVETLRQVEAVLDRLVVAVLDEPVY